MPFVLLIFLVTGPMLELYVLIRLGQWMGAIQTVALVVLMGIAGAALARQQGLAALRRIQEDLARGIIPADNILDGLLVAAGGLLLVFPGVLSDIAGLTLAAPPTRRIIRAYAKYRIGLWLAHGGKMNVYYHRAGPSPQPERDDDVIDV